MENKTRHISQDGLDLIKRFEGFRPAVYRDAVGLPTIGYGHLIKQGATFDRPITEREAEELLRRDVSIAERAVLRLISVPLSDGQFAALVSFVFNLGAGALQRSTLRMKLNRGDIADAADEFIKWIRAGGRVLRGLVLRRNAERSMFLGGI